MDVSIIMKLSSLKAGHIFEYYLAGCESMLGIKTVGIATPKTIPVIIDIDYAIMDIEKDVSVLCKIEDLDVDIHKSLQHSILKDVQNGFVFQTSSQYGLLSTYCKTNHKTFTGSVCAALVTPTGLPMDLEVKDLGYAGDYNDLPFDGMKRIDAFK